MELSVKKSQELAMAIEMLKPWLYHVDVEYAKEVSKGMFEQANRQESLSVLHPSYPQKKNEVIRIQATALDSLIEFIELLQEADKLKLEIGEEKKIREEISSLFI